MKRPFNQTCRHCGCTNERSCAIVHQRGVRDCEWERADLCDNPQCLIAAAIECERAKVGGQLLSEASRLRERADNVRRGRLV